MPIFRLFSSQSDINSRIFICNSGCNRVMSRIYSPFIPRSHIYGRYMYRTQRGVFSHQLDDISGSIELPLLRLRGDTELPEEILINPPDHIICLIRGVLNSVDLINEKTVVDKISLSITIKIAISPSHDFPSLPYAL